MAALLLLVPATGALAGRAARHVAIVDRSVARMLHAGRLRVRVIGRAHEGIWISAAFRGAAHRRIALAKPRVVELGSGGTRTVSLRLTRGARERIRYALAVCRPLALTITALADGSRARTTWRLRGGRGCHRAGIPHFPPGSPGAEATPHGAAARFSVGAAVVDFTPPAHGALPGDPADCSSGLSGPRQFAFEEPYTDLQGSGHYDPGDPYVDCNGNGRWDGNYIGGGGNSPRYYVHVADPVTARALVVGNGERTIAVEVVDNEGLFNTYMDAIRARVAADGYKLDGIFISSTHDESAPDTIGLYGPTPATSSVNNYFGDYLVQKAAQAIEQAYAARRPATIRYAEASEPANMRQCWSSYPYTDDQLMPVLQAVGTDGRTIATLASVSQHAETLGFNDNVTEGQPEGQWLSGDWPYWFRSALEARYGGVGIEMAGSVGSVESPEVWSGAISRTPQRFVDERHPAGCRTLFDKSGSETPLGYGGETRAFGQQLAAAVGSALSGATASTSNVIYGEHQDVCVTVTNGLFVAGGALGVFARRPTYTAGCSAQAPLAPNGSATGTDLRTGVAAYRIGDGEFMSVPGEVFPFTFLRGFQGPHDMPYPQYAMPPWPVPHMRAPYRFVDGLGEDMIGYIFPRGNGVGVPGEYPATNPQASDTDRFGCGHSDDSESASSQAGDILGAALVQVLDRHEPGSETVVEGRYVLPDGSLSRDPLGGPEVKCNVDTVFHATGPAAAVELPGGKVVHPAAWMSLSGRPQAAPDRSTRGYFTAAGQRVWLDVFPDVKLP